MKTGTITTTPHGSVMSLEGCEVSADWQIIQNAAASYGAREHLTLWSDSAERSFFDLIGDDVPAGLRLSIGDSLSAFHVGKVHVRSISAFCDMSVGDLCRDYEGDANDYASRLVSMRRYMAEVGAESRRFGVEKTRGTAASTAHDIWRTQCNASGRWRCSQKDTVEDLDFVRGALYGGKTLAMVKGCVYTPGNLPRTLVEDLGAPAFETPPGFRLWRLDARSAYPSHMRRDLPYPWDCISDEFDLDFKHGVASAEIEINDNGPRVVPLRVQTRQGIRTVWPEPGSVVRGTWSYFTLREAVKHGARILNVDRARTYRTATHPLRQFVDRIWRGHKKIERASVQKTIKSYSRRLNGKFGVSRWQNVLVPLETYFDRVGRDHNSPFPRFVIGDYAIVREAQDQYPSFAQTLWSATTIDRATIVLSRIEFELAEVGIDVLYVDTDSIMFVAEEDPRGGPCVPDSVRKRMGNGLGDWRVDFKGDWAILFGEKFYALSDGKTAFSGIPREIQRELLHNGQASYEQSKTIQSDARTVNFTLNRGQFQEA